ncbi:hypothetical protein IMZ48_22250 [Candidatus Bathyarchaeota archaeon]|nr:hypothetical protein [Candidatus Bathyarchaeota archaeon]
MPVSSPFLQSSFRSAPNTLAIVHLSRDNLVPVLLNDGAAAPDGYAEGAVLNSRFGSFPHSTLIGVPWGSQVRASTVDTGSRGRKRKVTEAAAEASASATPDVDPSELKRKREDSETTDPKRQKGVVGDVIPNDEGACDKEQSSELQSASQAPTAKQAVTASSGFVHILKPSPELWTVSLPHRTQVVYTPDYSYVLQRLRAFPGKTIIEAGAGSGSFTHASARAVHNGFPSGPEDKRGKVYSFEYHAQRFEQMQLEISQHGLEGIVQLTHRDVCGGGFNVDGKSPKANAVFLDLPAPWDALHHLSRQRPTQIGSDASKNGDESWVSPLDPEQSVHLCTFSPCIEQVIRTIEKMRDLGWVNIEMVEVAHKKLHITRDRVGLNVAPERGSTQAPGDVLEAVSRLKFINARAEEYHAKDGRAADADVQMEAEEACDQGTPAASAKPWREGRLVHRADSELKTHTSYLVFAVLPREWSDEQEAEALARWPLGNETGVIGTLDKVARKNMKREQMDQGKKSKKKRKDQ